MLRIERALLTLKGWLDPSIMTLRSMEVVSGDYKSQEEANRSQEWKTVELPWFIAAHDERYFLKIPFHLPKVKPGRSFFVEISTGREGEWDAVNPQLLAYVNGEIVCGLDTNHRLIPLAEHLQEQFVEIGLHLYTGMTAGDLRFRAKVIERCEWIYEAYHDLRVVVETLKCLPQASEEAVFIKRILTEAVYDLRLGSPEDDDTRVSCQALTHKLHTELYGKPSTMGRYTVHAVGHTHIDVAWLWDLKQTQEKVGRSFATATELQSRYPEYKFMASQPVLYEMLAEGQPDIFSRVKKSALNGLWEAEGAMYLEADCNLIGGESMIRQLEWGQRYFKNHFGKPSKTLWLPDVFGYSAAMPQILKGFDLELFVTSKISWNESNQLPYDSFCWRGIDGTDMPTQFITTTAMETLSKGEFKTIYEGNFTPTEVLGTVLRHQQRDIQPHAIMPFGFGDGGGGATETMLETAKRLVKGLPGMPIVTLSFVSDFLKGYQRTPSKNLPIWSGELYLEYHRGTYTTNGWIKQKHRQLEDALLLAERLHATLQPVCHESPLSQTLNLEMPWQRLLLNQFHDILPGTSVKRVYDEAYAQLDEALECVMSQIAEWVKAVSAAKENSNTGKVSFFNRLGHSYRGILHLTTDEWLSVKAQLPQLERCEACHLSMNEKTYQVQALGNGGVVVFVDSLKPLAFTEGQWTAMNLSEVANLVKTGVANGEPVKLGLQSGIWHFETDFYKVIVNEDGNLTGLYDKIASRELIASGGLGNRLSCFEDRPHRWDAWDINEDYEKFPLAFKEGTQVAVLENGSVAMVIEVKKTIGKSTICQQIYFYHEHSRIDFKTIADWHEQQVLLRTTFELDLNVTEALYDIQFGHVKRPVDRNHSYHQAMFEVCAAHWGDLSENDYGVAIMSNDKFGYSAVSSTLGLSLIKSPTWPNAVSDQGVHCFEYALWPHAGDSLSGGVHREALSYLQRPIMIVGSVSETIQESWIGGLPENLFIESLRRLEEGCYELRLAEHFNRRGKAQLTFREGILRVERTNLTGQTIGIVNALNTVYASGSVEEFGMIYEIDYKGFEILTLRLWT